jgi:hypothetical protein
MVNKPKKKKRQMGYDMRWNDHDLIVYTHTLSAHSRHLFRSDADINVCGIFIFTASHFAGKVDGWCCK